MKINGERGLTDSPCRGICTATALGDDVCKGCGRTSEEVAKWLTLSDDQKMEINRRLIKAKSL